jgi:hypothetical protein
MRCDDRPSRVPEKEKIPMEINGYIMKLSQRVTEMASPGSENRHVMKT